jgi:hypothetical protein
MEIFVKDFDSYRDYTVTVLQPFFDRLWRTRNGNCHGHERSLLMAEK